MRRPAFLIISAIVLLLTLTGLTVTAAAEQLPTVEEIFILGDKAPRDLNDYGDPLPLTEQRVKDIYGAVTDCEEITALLRAGATLDLFDYTEKYGVDKVRAHTLTQYALDILTETTSHKKVTAGLTSKERCYLAAVLKAAFERTPIPSEIIPEGSFLPAVENGEGDYVSGTLKMKSKVGGILRINDEESGVKVYTLSGDEAPYLVEGQTFYLKGAAPFTPEAYTVEHIYHVPEIMVYYHKNGDFSPIITARMGQESTVMETRRVVFVSNPDTSDGNMYVNVLYFTAMLLQVLFCVKLHRGSKDIEIG